MVQTKEQSQAVLLGHVDVPSGILLIIDPGMSRYWQHDANPDDTKSTNIEMLDLRIEGPDALKAGKEFDRQFDPRYIFDVVKSELDDWHSMFAEFVKEQKLNAHLQVLEKRISHVERARLAVECGEGAGVAQYDRLWAIAVGGLPTDRPLPVMAVAMDDNEFAGRWRTVDIVIDEKATTARSETTEGVMVDYGQLMCADLEAFGEFKMWQSVDGLADFVFWGADADQVALKFGADKLNDEDYGWVDLPMDEASAHGEKVQAEAQENDLKIALDFRPHCNLEKLNSQIRRTDLESGELVLKGAKTCGFSNRWGDGIFEVVRDLDDKGNLIRIRLDLGSEKRQVLMRQIALRYSAAIVTKKILDGEPIIFAERLEPNNEQDSGWCFSAGTESDEYMTDPNNMALVALGSLIQRDDALNAIIEAPVGSVFRREEGGYVPEAADDE